MPALRRYEVSIADDHEGKHTTHVVALSAAKAKYEYYLDARDAWPDFQWKLLRCRSMGIAYPHATKLQSEVERKQLEILRHALGLDHLGLNKQGGYEGYRNHYALYRTSDDYAFLMDMCSTFGRLPLMGWRAADTLAQGMVYFHVTIGGHDFVKARTGIDHTKAVN